ncbi:outer membrane protease [Salmonella enterica subsp. enterica serovar Newport str. 36803]|nr:outer membrane protease [Salmonella enterica subsp. enterica serovar Newport str. 36803]
MKKHAIAVMMIAVFSESVYAESTLFIPDVSPDSVTTSLSVGVLNGKSRELVYDTDTGRKISQLDWKIKNVATLQGDLSWEPYSFMTLDARGWTSLASGSGHMVDHDWMSSEQPGWTDRSIHPDTSANYANEYDLNVKGWLLQGDNYKAGVTAGYQETRFSWTARGGSYIYDNGRYIGNFPHGVRGIGYSQRFEMPYIGLAGDYRINDFECNVLFKYSDWVNAHDNDEHYMRKLTFREKRKIHDIMARLLTPDIILPVMQKSLLSSLTVNMKKVRAVRKS